MLHQITKATPWWEELPCSELVKRMLKMMLGSRANSKHDHWEVGQNVQEQERLWEKQELRKKKLQLHSGWVFWERLRQLGLAPLGLELMVSTPEYPWRGIMTVTIMMITRSDSSLNSDLFKKRLLKTIHVAPKGGHVGNMANKREHHHVSSHP